MDRCENCDADRGDGYCQECPDDPDRPKPVGQWWLDDGRDSGVWPVKVVGFDIFNFVKVEGTNPGGPYYGETISVERKRVYDSNFNHPTRENASV